MTDQELVIRARAGDIQSFTELVKRYSNAVYGVAYSRLGDYHEAQDVAQEVFLRAYMHLHQLRFPEKVGAWLYSIASRISIRANNAHNNSQLALYETHLGIEAPSTTNVEVHEALAKLPEASKQTLVLYYLAGYNAKEIAEFTGVSSDAIQKRLQRARESMKREMLGLVEHNLRENKLGEDFDKQIEEFLRNGKRDEALTLTRNVLAGRPTDIGVQKWYAQLLRECSHEHPEMEDTYLDEAERAYVRLASTDRHQFWGLGQVYLQRMEYGKALECFRKLKQNTGLINDLDTSIKGKGDFFEATTEYQDMVNQGMYAVMTGLRGLVLAHNQLGEEDAAKYACYILINTLEAFGEPGKYKFDLWSAYVDLARLQVKTSHHEALESLYKAYDVARTYLEGETFLFKRLGAFAPRPLVFGDDLGWFRQELIDDIFRPLRDYQEYKSLLEMVDTLLKNQA